MVTARRWSAAAADPARSGRSRRGRRLEPRPRRSVRRDRPALAERLRAHGTDVRLDGHSGRSSRMPGYRASTLTPAGGARKPRPRGEARPLPRGARSASGPARSTPRSGSAEPCGSRAHLGYFVGVLSAMPEVSSNGRTTGGRTPVSYQSENAIDSRPLPGGDGSARDAPSPSSPPSDRLFQAASRASMPRPAVAAKMGFPVRYSATGGSPGLAKGVGCGKNCPSADQDVASTTHGGCSRCRGVWC